MWKGLNKFVGIWEVKLGKKKTLAKYNQNCYTWNLSSCLQLRLFQSPCAEYQFSKNTVMGWVDVSSRAYNLIMERRQNDCKIKKINTKITLKNKENMTYCFKWHYACTTYHVLKHLTCESLEWKCCYMWHVFLCLKSVLDLRIFEKEVPRTRVIIRWKNI